MTQIFDCNMLRKSINISNINDRVPSPPCHMVCWAVTLGMHLFSNIFLEFLFWLRRLFCMRRFTELALEFPSLFRRRLFSRFSLLPCKGPPTTSQKNAPIAGFSEVAPLQLDP